MPVMLQVARFTRKLTNKDIKARGHDNRTQPYKGAAHQQHNIADVNKQRCLLVVLHQVKGYDSQLIIMQAVDINQQLGNNRIESTPNSIASYYCSIGGLRLLDSFDFMASSLTPLYLSCIMMLRAT